MTELDRLEAALGCQFTDRTLLRLALTHPSVAHEQGIPLQHNQRLEFLGDSVLELVLTHELYRRFPALGEGTLTKARARRPRAPARSGAVPGAEPGRGNQRGT
jgi:ribonuclease-3